MAETAATNTDTEIINKLRIDWTKAGICWKNPSDAFIGDRSQMKHYCDQEIEGSYYDETDTRNGGMSIETYRVFSEQLRVALLSGDNGDDDGDGDGSEWTCERGHGSLTNFRGGGIADIISYTKKKEDDSDGYSCRIEYWEHPPGGGWHKDDNVCLLEATEHGLVLIVGCFSSHPYVACNLLSFGNSDGSTRRTRLDTSSPNALILAALTLAERYLYSQSH